MTGCGSFVAVAVDLIPIIIFSSWSTRHLHVHSNYLSLYVLVIRCLLLDSEIAVFYLATRLLHRIICQSTFKFMSDSHSTQIQSLFSTSSELNRVLFEIPDILTIYNIHSELLIYAGIRRTPHKRRRNSQTTSRPGQGMFD